MRLEVLGTAVDAPALGAVEVDDETGAVTPAGVLADIVSGVLQRCGGRLERLPGWTNGYFSLRAAPAAPPAAPR